jgi:hypothetical protein
MHHVFLVVPARGKAMSAPVETGGQIVVRFRDGRLIKGRTADFNPSRNKFHVQVEGSGAVVAVETGGLKAVFFVHSYAGNPKHVDQDAGNPPGQGRRIEVTFTDGEVLHGCTQGYSPEKPGFFVIPSDPKGNNNRVFVLRAAVARVHWC